MVYEVQFLYQEMYMEFIKMRELQDRSKVIRLFHEKQLAATDGKGLKIEEFKDFVKTIDEGSKDGAHNVLEKEFEFIDANADGYVDLEEFEKALAKGFVLYV